MPCKGTWIRDDSSVCHSLQPLPECPAQLVRNCRIAAGLCPIFKASCLVTKYFMEAMWLQSSSYRTSTQRKRTPTVFGLGRPVRGGATSLLSESFTSMKDPALSCISFAAPSLAILNEPSRTCSMPGPLMPTVQGRASPRSGRARTRLLNLDVQMPTNSLASMACRGAWRAGS